MKKQQAGRSMIEMIGVLMVLAIVSVTGLVTYDYAKDRWWETDLAQTITKVLTIAKTKQREVSDRELRLVLPKGIHSIETAQVTTTNEDGIAIPTPYKMAVITFSKSSLECSVEAGCASLDALNRFGLEIKSVYEKTYQQGTVEITSGVAEVISKADKKAMEKNQ